MKRPRERGQQKSLPTTSHGQRHHQRHLSLALASSTCYAGHEMRSGAERGLGCRGGTGACATATVARVSRSAADSSPVRRACPTFDLRDRGYSPFPSSFPLSRLLPFNFNSFSLSNSAARYSALLIELCIIYCIFILVFPSCCHKLRFHIKMSRGM